MKISEFISLAIDETRRVRGKVPEFFHISPGLFQRLVYESRLQTTYDPNHGHDMTYFQGIKLYYNPSVLKDHVEVVYDSSVSDWQSFDYTAYETLYVGNVILNILPPPNASFGSPKISGTWATYNPKAANPTPVSPAPQKWTLSPPGWYNITLPDGMTVADPLAKREPEKKVCRHEFKPYYGLWTYPQYEYCVHCDQKKDCNV